MGRIENAVTTARAVVVELDKPRIAAETNSVAVVCVRYVVVDSEICPAKNKRYLF